MYIYLFYNIFYFINVLLIAQAFVLLPALKAL
jgi:hypothetical protein